MSHIHIPDGVLPLWLVAAGWVMTLALLFLIARRLSGPEGRRKIPLLGVMAALMLVGMSTEFVPIAYHVNLSVLAGIIVGPAMGFLAAFIVDLILALFGHGGITVVGLNSSSSGPSARWAMSSFAPCTACSEHGSNRWRLGGGFGHHHIVRLDDAPHRRGGVGEY